MVVVEEEEKLVMILRVVGFAVFVVAVCVWGEDFQHYTMEYSFENSGCHSREI